MTPSRGLSLALASAALSATCVAFSCLPDLDVEAPVSPTCGDGVTDLDKGEQCDPGDAGDAGTAGCTATCALACDAGFTDESTGHCYYWTLATSTATGASNECFPAHVVTFGSEAELSFVSATAGKAPGAPGTTFTAWNALIFNAQDGGPGYYRQGGETGWGKDCPGCYARIDDPDAATFPLRPLADGGVNKGAAGDCVSWSKSLVPPWYASSCDLSMTGTRPVLCEREPPGSWSRSCQDPANQGDLCVAIPATFSTKRYRIVASPKTSDDARAGCASRGGRLVTLASVAEREAVMGEVGAAGLDEVWIGLTGAGGAWTWDDGTPLAATPNPWGDLEPKSTMPARAFVRVAISAYDTRLAHASDDPAATRAFVCELPPP